MAKYNARIGLRCYYWGRLEVDAENQEEAERKMKCMVDTCLGNSNGEVRTYFSVPDFEDEDKTYMFNISKSIFDVLSIEEELSESV